MPLTLYGIQLALNLAWSPLFFKQHEIGFALADITGTACTEGKTVSICHSWSQFANLLSSLCPQQPPACRHQSPLDVT